MAVKPKSKKEELSTEEKAKIERQTHWKMLAQQMQQIIIESMSTRNKTKFYTKYSEENVATYLADPIRYETQLRNISRYLAVASPQYFRLISYFPSIAVLKPLLVPSDIEKLMKNANKSEKQFYKALTALENMCVPHEFLQVLTVAYRDDVFYGYEVETDSSYSIKMLDPEFCRIIGTYDGCFIYEFNFGYFDSRAEDLANYALLDPLFQSQYNAYKNGSANQWQTLDPIKSICVKTQETLSYGVPPFISVFNDLYDILVYKDLNKNKFEQEINQFIGLKVPLREDSEKNDDFLLEGDTIQEYFSFMNACLAGKATLFMTPMEFEAMSFNGNGTNNATYDAVNNATKSFWASTGVADVLVGENKNAGTLKYSIKTDEALLFQVYRQIERILSKKIKSLTSNMFKVSLPNITVFNISDLHAQYVQDAGFGFNGAITMVDALNGFTQGEAFGLGYIENTILQKTNNMTPVQSTHTTSSSDAGRPTEDETDITESGQTSRDNSVTENR